MIALVVVVLDEGVDLGFEIARQEVVFEQDAVLEGLMPPLDFALAFADDMVHHENASCLCLSTIPPSPLRRNWTRCH